MKTNRVSMAVAAEILKSRPEQYVYQKLSWLKGACRHVWEVTIDHVDMTSTKYLMICGSKHGHRGVHEDIDGGVICER